MIEIDRQFQIASSSVRLLSPAGRLTMLLSGKVSTKDYRLAPVDPPIHTGRKIVTKLWRGNPAEVKSYGGLCTTERLTNFYYLITV